MKSCVRTITILGMCLCLLVVASCVKDVDFDQTEDIVIAPKVDLDLIFFSLNTSNFVGAATGNPIAVVRDTTRLEFLDDTFVQENLKEIDFLFRYDNSFSQSFVNRAVFLDEADEVQYEIEFDVTPSINGSTETTTFTQTVAETDLDAIKASIKLLIELTLEPNGDPIDGSLRHQSKALYSLEFEDF